MLQQRSNNQPSGSFQLRWTPLRECARRPKNRLLPLKNLGLAVKRPPTEAVLRALFYFYIPDGTSNQPIGCTHVVFQLSMVTLHTAHSKLLIWRPGAINLVRL